MRLTARIALVLGMALASGLIVATVSVAINTAITWQLPYACNPVSILSPSVIPGGQGARGTRFQSGGNETVCRFAMQPWWVEASGIAGFFAGGMEGVLIVRRRRRDHSEAIRPTVPITVG